MFHYARRIRSSVCIYFGLVGQQCKLNFKYLRRILNEIWFKIVFRNVAEDSQKLFQNKAEDVSFLLVYRLMGVGALIRALGWMAHHIPRYVPGTSLGTVRLRLMFSTSTISVVKRHHAVVLPQSSSTNIQPKNKLSTIERTKGQNFRTNSSVFNVLICTKKRRSRCD